MNLEIKIEKPVFGGDFISHNEDKTFFVRYSLPNEIINSNLFKKKKNSYFIKDFNVIKPSPKRIIPSCPIFSECGGCSYLHTDYETELLFKKQIFLDSFKRIAKLPFLKNTEIISSHRFNYRSRVSIKHKNGKTGFFRYSSNEVITLPKDGCKLLNPTLNNFILNNKFTKDTTISMDSESNIISSSDKLFQEKCLNLIFLRNNKNFFQINSFLRENLLQEIINIIKKYNVTGNLADLGCGIGFFSIALANHFEKVSGFDIEKTNIKSALKNKSINNKPNIFFKHADMSDFSSSKIINHCIIADPPRSGLNESTIKNIISSNFEYLIYISCNPATWCRDCSIFESNAIKLQEVKLMDMFPGTHHMEIISIYKNHSSS